MSNYTKDFADQTTCYSDTRIPIQKRGGGNPNGDRGLTPDAIKAYVAENITNAEANLLLAATTEIGDWVVEGDNTSSATITTGTTTGGQIFSNFNGASLIYRDSSGSNTIEASATGIGITTDGSATDRLTINSRDARYAADYSSGYSSRSLVDKGYVDACTYIDWNTAFASGTQSTSSWTADNAATNVNAAIVPKGNGGILGAVPDGTSAGGNARGQYAVDLQTLRTNASDVASGNYSTIPGGRRCTASGQYSFATGFRATASGDGSVCFGGSGSFSVGASATASNSFAFGTGADATATNAIAFLADASAVSAVGFGRNADKYAMFATIPVAFLKWGNQLTIGTGTYELKLDGSSLKASIPSGERWQFEVCVSATTAVVGDGTGTTNHQYFASYVGVIRNIGGTTSLLGTVDALMAAKADATISDASFAITADDTNDYLKIVFTPPSTAGSSSQYSVGASIKIFPF